MTNARRKEVCSQANMTPNSAGKKQVDHGTTSATLASRQVAADEAPRASIVWPIAQQVFARGATNAMPLHPRGKVNILSKQLVDMCF